MKYTFGKNAHQKFIWIINVQEKKDTFAVEAHEKYIWSICGRKPGEKLRFTRKLCQTCPQVAICGKSQ